MKILVVAAMAVALSGCGAKQITFDQYQSKVMLCEHLGMRVHVVNTISGGVPEVKEVVCYDKHGASWNTEQMSSRQ